MGLHRPPCGGQNSVLCATLSSVSCHPVTCYSRKSITLGTAIPTATHTDGVALLGNRRHPGNYRLTMYQHSVRCSMQEQVRRWKEREKELEKANKNKKSAKTKKTGLSMLSKCDIH